MINMNMNDAYTQAEQETASYGAMPNADYPVIVENAEYKQFKSGKWGVSLMYAVYNHPQFDNRKLFDNFMLFESDGATECTWTDNNGNVKNIGKLNYAKVCAAAGLTPDQASDPNNLLQKTLVIRTKQKAKDDGSGEMESVPSVYKPVAQVQGGMQAQQPQQQQAQTQQQQGGAFGGQQQGVGQQNVFQGQSNAFSR